MNCYSNSTTARLEGHARKLGLNYSIIISPDNSGGRIFACGDEDGPWTHWLSLGWTKDEAMTTLDFWATETQEEKPLHDYESWVYGRP